jgi:hypothetical protein
MAAKSRDLRIDLFRGIAMFIILVAHIPFDTWALFIPARFGFSDAAEIFVFCSGFASAKAFGRVFHEAGFAMGLVRVLHRCWQIYWAHICLFLVVAATCVVADRLIGGPKIYVGELNLWPFFDRTPEALVGLLTLSYVPNFFDVLPMYMVILAMLPGVMLLRRLHPAAPFIGVFALWAVVQATSLNFGAEPWSDRPWFFNPLGWQLVFFTGFAISMRWVEVPAVSSAGVVLSIVILVLAIPFSWVPGFQAVPFLGEARGAIAVLVDKTDYGLLRWIHFLAIAYLCRALVHAVPRIVELPALRPVIKVGQQSLAVFLASMALAWALGIVLDVVGHEAIPTTIVNLAGFAAITAVAYLAAYVKSTPWKRLPEAAPGRADHAIVRPEPAPLRRVAG